MFTCACKLRCVVLRFMYAQGLSVLVYVLLFALQTNIVVVVCVRNVFVLFVLFVNSICCYCCCLSIVCLLCCCRPSYVSLFVFVLLVCVLFGFLFV